MQSDPEIAEQQWLTALSAGDESALRRIFDRHYALLLGDIYRIIPDENTCQDLAQEVFVELWRKRAELDIHTSLRAYLRRAAVNRALNHLKASRRLALDESVEQLHVADESEREIAEKADRDSMEKALHAAIDALPEKCRLVFSLSRFEHLSHREISEKLGISVKTIENQITKAMKLLRQALARHADLSPVVILALKYWWGM
ncbi:MAG: RNA polymerase sigma-70 factor [Saprospiraceae bacterium]|nr:RNA polymerase sigma-70 factor [Saprospiraceae bacterium]MCB0543001.1 RNA polymerase sigma-70 factor [Saprospiraceae bacterium]MCB0575327.1 RNA polymerase sigma-70 factor [Saprospiraceae bacterium]MCB9307672.1 RNA polymerase sigma-70 factor [Lewinellaceae bacterium]MCB9353940.1 RNA polymerase sigma-70 factor [Lewinellaceae bacterium]